MRNTVHTFCPQEYCTIKYNFCFHFSVPAAIVVTAVFLHLIIIIIHLFIIIFVFHHHLPLLPRSSSSFSLFFHHFQLLPAPERTTKLTSIGRSCCSNNSSGHCEYLLDHPGK